MLKVNGKLLNNEVLQKIHLSSFLLISLTDMIQELRQSGGPTESFVLMVRHLANDTGSNVLYCVMMI